MSETVTVRGLSRAVEQNRQLLPPVQQSSRSASTTQRKKV